MGVIRNCQGCGKEFYTLNYTKKFCTFPCYIASPEFKSNCSNAKSKSLENKVDCICEECGAKFTTKSKRRRRFCNRTCLRRWNSARFDRFVANPEKIALPQCYDEFLTKDRLNCLFEGCGWVGRNLANHVNMVHGVTAERFKEMVGFNHTTGLVCPELSNYLSEKAKGIFSEHPENLRARGIFCGQEAIEKGKTKGTRLEGREHYLKALAVPGFIESRSQAHKEAMGNPELRKEIGKRLNRTRAKNTTKVCTVCGEVYEVSILNASNSLYCGVVCRRAAHIGNYQEQRNCTVCGKPFSVYRYDDTLTCSRACKMKTYPARILTCETCQVPYEVRGPWNNGKHYCSPKCRAKANRMRKKEKSN